MLRFLALLAAGGVLATTAAGLAGAGTDLRAGEPTAPAALIWGSGLFFDRPAFEQWLQLHHRGYPVWASLHPRARTILESPVQPVRFTSIPLRGPKPPPSTVFSGPPASSLETPLLLALGLVGLALVALSALPFRRVAPASAFASLVGERRIGVSASGIAILVGIVVAKLAGS